MKSRILSFLALTLVTFIWVDCQCSNPPQGIDTICAADPMRETCPDNDCAPYPCVAYCIEHHPSHEDIPANGLGSWCDSVPEYGEFCSDHMDVQACLMWCAAHSGECSSGGDGDADADADSDGDGDGDEEICQPQDRLSCNETGDVIWLDSCGQPEDSIHEDCPDNHGLCRDGACECEEGWRGDGCTWCLVFVNGATGNDENTGFSWEQALESLTAGLEKAGLSGCEIWVAEGTYYPSDVASRDATFQLIPGVELYGGFAGTESTRDERDITGNPTILSGDIDRNGALDNGNVYHVVTGADESILDGFTITGGNANHSGVDPRATGGGMYNVNASPVVANCWFEANEALNGGGGMYNENSVPTVTHTTFYDNRATENYGGGMYNYEASPIVTDCLFTRNLARTGAGMTNYLSSPTVTNCRFTRNQSGHSGGGMSNTDSSPILTNCIFYWNEVDEYSGGGISNSNSSPTIINCSFRANEAGRYGGGIENISSSSPTITNSIFWGNSARISNNEIYADKDSNPEVTYSDIQGGYEGDENINANPLWDGPMRLTEGSPCIDAGDNSVFLDGATDLDGNPRIINGDLSGSSVVDMGPYEYDPSL